MEKQALLIMGDSPSGHSGLGRILRDVALRIHEHMGDVFDVATLGFGAPPDASLPFQQYHAASAKDWIVTDLPWVWKAHTKGRPGILFSFWDISRLLWLAHPEQCPDLVVQNFLLNEFKGQKYIYPAIDGAGPTGSLPIILKEALAKFDRVLNYTQFSAKITGYPDVCTHGIDTSVFYPRPDARQGLKKFGVELEEGEALIGIVATNQSRKRWDIVFSALAELNRRGMKVRAWLHTDTDMRHWDLKALYLDFGLQPNVKVFLTPYGLPDDDLAALYSACDCTIGPGVEGWGYPAGESLCCGTPHVTGSYGGCSDFVPSEYLVDPIAFQYEGVFAIQRPVYNSSDWVEKIRSVIGKKADIPTVIDWNAVWDSWDKWLRSGL